MRGLGLLVTFVNRRRKASQRRFMNLPCTAAAGSDPDKVRADIANIEVEPAAPRSQFTKALDALGA